MEIIQNLGKAGAPMPQVINNTTLKNAMDDFIRQAVADRAAGNKNHNEAASTGA